MTHPAYPAARAAAARIHPHLARHLAAANLPPEKKPASLPGLEIIEAVIDAAFWASLHREEGRTPLLSLAFVTPEQVTYPLMFERPLALASQSLTRVAPAVERPGIHLGVWRNGGDLCLWGATRNLPAFCFVLEVIAAGLLVIKQSPAEESGKFINVAVLEGDEIKVVDQLAATVPDCPAVLTSLLGFETHYSSAESVSVLIQLAVSMRAHSRGGSLLVVPSNTEVWRESISQPVVYSVAPPFSALADLMEADPAGRSQRWWQDSLRRAVDAVAGLTAVDGATVITTRYELLAFGAKIIRRPRWAPVNRVILTEPIEGAAAQIIESSQLGGTRHLSAAQFSQDQRDAIALIASQDGRFTVFAWSPCEEMVHAHRIESLLL
jgi:hypothetical protein